MASAAIAPAAQTNGSMSSEASSKTELADYETIIRLHNEIRFGTHPRLKAPAHLDKLIANPAQTSSTSSARPAAANAIAKPPPTQAAAANVPPKQSIRRAATKQLALEPAPKPGPAQFDPVLLTKSDKLVKAEFKVRREHIERALKERFLQKRSQKKDTEPLPDFDVSEAFTKALALVPPISAPGTESIDDNSYYSSQHHDSPQSIVREISGCDAESQDVTMADAGDIEAQDGQHGSSSGASRHRKSIQSGSSKENERPATVSNHSHRVDTTQFFGAQDPKDDIQAETNLDAAEASKFIESTINGNRSSFTDIYPPDLDREPTDKRRHEQVYNTNQRHHGHTPIGVANNARPAEKEPHSFHGLPGIRVSPRESPDDRTQHQHDQPTIITSDLPLLNRRNLDSPVAPQPSRISPLAVARLPAVAREGRAGDGLVSQPFSSGPSPDVAAEENKGSPPHKRRKVVAANNRFRLSPPRSTRNGHEPHIKQEPVSPRPLSLTINRSERYNEQPQRRGDPGHESDRPEVSGVAAYTPSEAPPGYGRYGPGTPGTTGPAPGAFRGSVDITNRNRADFRRYASYQHSRRQPSPMYEMLTPVEYRPVRAVSRTSFEQPSANNVRYYREEVPAYRGQYIERKRSASPPPRRRYSPSEARSMVMAAPNRASQRVTVDEDGRRYIEAPSNGVVMHSSIPRDGQSAVARSSHGNRDSYFERPHVPVRVVDNSYSERRYLDPSATSPPSVVRRVVEHRDERDYRAQHYREYSARPNVIMPREEYVLAREVPDRKPISEYSEVVLPRNYVQRIPNERSENVRYEYAHEYGPRPHGSHTELANGGYGRRGVLEPIPHSAREFSVRPEEPRREYVPAHPERYAYVPEPPSRRYLDEVTYIQRPRESTQDIQGGGLRRASYRY